MQDRPTAIELLEAGAEFVDRELVPVVEGARQFQTRVVANLMRIVAREIASEDPMVRAEVKALAELLGREKPHVHSLEDLHKVATELNTELSARVRAGDADAGDFRARTLSIVRRTVEDKLRIANPRYIESDIAIRAESSKK